MTALHHYRKQSKNRAGCGGGDGRREKGALSRILNQKTENFRKIKVAGGLFFVFCFLLKYH